MSLLTKASLVTTPTAYDGGVLNSVKPVSRENLLLQSNQFDTTWLNAATTETSGQSGYDGSSDAWRLDKTNAGGYIYQNISQSGIQTFSVYAKAGTSTWIQVVANGSANALSFFDLDNGVLGATSANIISRSIESAGNGYYRCSISVNIGTITRVRLYPAEGDNDTSGTSGNIYIQDAQLQKGITATQYVETTTEAVQNGDFSFSRASAATRVNEQGLIEKERGNLSLYSNTFSSWNSVSGGSVTSGEAGYDGTSDAWLLTSGAATYSRIERTISYTGLYTISVYAKAGSLGWLSFENSGISGDESYFDLTTGTLGSLGANVVSADIENIGSGWYRCSATLNGTSNVQRIYPAVGNGDLNSAQGSIYIQDFQFEQGLVATDYIETTTAAVYEDITDNIPRINYENGIGDFLLEPQRTNVLQNSEYFSGSYWINNGVTITDNAAISPEGKTNAALLTGVSGGFGIVKFSTWTATNKVASCFAKAGSGNIFKIANVSAGNRYVLFDLSDGTISEESASWSGSIEDYGNGWYRCTAISNNETGTFSLGTTAASDSVYIYGAQLEAGSYATSYIPTYGTSVTFASETCNNAGDSSLFNDSEGVFYAEVQGFKNGGSTRVFSVSDGSTSNNVYVNLSPTSNVITAEILSGGVAQCNLSTATTNQTNSNKIAVKYKINDFALWINGVEVDTDSSGITPTGLDRLNFDLGQGSFDFYGKTKMVATFTEALSDSELECLTSWSSFNRMATAQGYTIQ